MSRSTADRVTASSAPTLSAMRTTSPEPMRAVRPRRHPAPTLTLVPSAGARRLSGDAALRDAMRRTG